MMFDFLAFDESRNEEPQVLRTLAYIYDVAFLTRVVGVTDCKSTL